ncbi:hypothetical protein EDD36DRAFT_292842 [Exophiala viscosa]|uniref:Uncharacterized protein n=1 Tax=Exophiala viscosa TaxID=2486360 RepID=A0AAN6IBN2_9EURO|nr:hypothetical protein EDD36DRAFT_292842 [Exophiala viscosa]
MSSEHRKRSEDRRGSMISKMFHRKSHVNVDEVDDTSSLNSTTPLVHSKLTPKEKEAKNNMVYELTQQPNLTSTEERTSCDELMRKAKTMSPEEFKVYLSQHREEVETLGRNDGAGIPGLFWVYKDNTNGTNMSFESCSIVVVAWCFVGEGDNGVSWLILRPGNGLKDKDACKVIILWIAQSTYYMILCPFVESYPENCST